MPRTHFAALMTVAAIAVSLGDAPPALASAAAPSITIEKTFGKVAGWSIGYSATTGGCLAAATYGDETTIWFGFGGTSNTAFLAFTSPKWRSIEVGQSYVIQLVARGNGNWYGNFAGFERNGQKGIFEAGLTDKFISDLADAGSLDVSLAGRRIASLSLVGSLDALTIVAECQKSNGGNHERSVENKPDTSPTFSGVKPDDDEKSVQGTGFYVSDKGHVLTNNHVIESCTAITVTQAGSPPVKARLVAKDATNDLAVLSTDIVRRQCRL